VTARLETRASRGAVVPLRLVVAALVLAGALAALPLAAPLVIAAWTAELLEPLVVRLTKRFGGRERAGLALTLLVVLLILIPLTVLGVSLVAATADLLAELRKSKQASDLVRAFVPADLTPSLGHLSPQKIADFARRHGGSALTTLQSAFGAVTALAVGVIVYVAGVYESIANGPRFVAWLRERSLVSKKSFDRFSAAFVETGRGLFVGIGGTTVLQTVVATSGYVVVGVPYPLLLGFVTLLASLIPSVGTALVWVPVTVLLFVTDRTVGGIVLAVIGGFTSVVDNLVRPWLSRYGTLQLPMFVTFVAMLGGIVVFGGFGLLLGPLFVRLAVEALDIWRERRSVEET
jgi:predicted PurR-regulated permease PerM